jgi:hypothetical protein
MKRTRTAGLGVLFALTAAAALPGVAGAETITSPVSGGALSLTTQPVTFSGATLNGANQTVTASPDSAWSLTDARGTGSAWTATISASAPTSAAGSVETTARDIAVGTLSVNAGVVAAGTGSDPATNITGASSLALSGSDQTLISSTGSSKGTYTFSPSFSLLIPANAFRSNYSGVVGSTPLNAYTSTLTLSIS